MTRFQCERCKDVYEVDQTIAEIWENSISIPDNELNPEDGSPALICNECYQSFKFYQKKAHGHLVH